MVEASEPRCITKPVTGALKLMVWLRTVLGPAQVTSMQFNGPIPAPS